MKFNIGDWVIVEGLDPLNGVYKILADSVKIAEQDCYDV